MDVSFFSNVHPALYQCLLSRKVHVHTTSVTEFKCDAQKKSVLLFFLEFLHKL